MEKWQWARTVDRAGVARYVDADRAARVANLTLADSAYDLSAANDGRRRLAHQIYDGLLARAEQGQPMAYDRPEYNYEQDIQTIRTPEEVLVSPRQGTCLDLSLLYAGLCLHYGLLPLVALLDGHAYVAVSLTHSRSHDLNSGWQSFGRRELAAIEQGEGLLTEAAFVAQLIAQGTYLPVECTGFAYTHKLPDTLPEGRDRFMGYLSFEQAVVAGQAQLSHTERPFRYAAAIHYLQQKGVRPEGSPERSEERSTAGSAQPGSTFNVKNIRSLLIEGFTDGELRRLCFDEPDFKAVYHQLAQGMGKDQVVDKLMEYAEQKELVENLLVLLKGLNPRQYQKHQPYVNRPDSSTRSGRPHAPEAGYTGGIHITASDNANLDISGNVAGGNITINGGPRDSSQESLTQPAENSDFKVIGSLEIGRYHHISTLHSTEEVLIVGGYCDDNIEAKVLASAELFNTNHKMSTGHGRLVARRYFAAATLLDNNTLLISGGVGENGQSFDTVELYNFSSGKFSIIGQMTSSRRGHTATKLQNGKVLIAGGRGGKADLPLASAEIYDPIENSFTVTGRMTTPRLTEHTPNAVLLNDGRVLVAGGYDGISDAIASMEFYDPDKGTFATAGNMALRRACHTLTHLSNGKVLIVGGYADESGHLSSAEIYDPTTEKTILTQSMKAPHFHHSATLLPDDSVLIVGGNSPVAEIFNPKQKTFSVIGNLNHSRYLHTATLMPSGQVLIIGGTGTTNCSRTIEISPVLVSSKATY